MLKVNRYQIRQYPTPTSYSVAVGRKLVTWKQRCKIIKRLNATGIDVFSVKFEILKPG